MCVVFVIKLETVMYKVSPVKEYFYFAPIGFFRNNVVWIFSIERLIKLPRKQGNRIIEIEWFWRILFTKYYNDNIVVKTWFCMYYFYSVLY